MGSWNTSGSALEHSRLLWAAPEKEEATASSSEATFCCYVFADPDAKLLFNLPYSQGEQMFPFCPQNANPASRSTLCL